MKSPLKKIFVSAFLTCSALVSMVYMSCNNDKCKTIVCAYGGVCNQGSCICPTGYEGTNCETISSDKFLGTWQVLEKGSTTNAAQYVVSINQGTPINTVTITNFYNFFLTPIKAFVNHDTITIPNQQIQGKVIVGSGYIYSNTTSVTYVQYGNISLKYEVIDTATGRIDDFGYTPVDLSAPSAWNK
jgi:hypothetical protein